MTLAALDRSKAEQLLSRLGGRHILVVGDVMLDRFIVGTVARISPEAPVPVVRYRSEHVRLGGAANVAHNLAALGATVSLVGIVGQDAAADRLRETLATAGVSPAHLVVDRSRPTTEKVRVVTERNQQVARIDYEEDTEAGDDIQGAMLDRVGALADAGAILVSDYLKGSVTAAIVRALLEKRPPGVSVVVDPKVPHLGYYRGTSIITPNHHEAEQATHSIIRNEGDAQRAAQAIRADVGCEAVLITRGEQGMWLSGAGVEGAAPAAAREVSDVTGAGDTVVATLTLALAAGATLSEAAWLANIAAGVVVGKFGPATVSPAEILERI